MRKEIQLILILTLFVINSYAQKTETNISFNSGLFSFGGNSAAGSTFINYNETTKTGYANNPYGSRNGLCYGFSFQKKRVTKWNLIYGFDLGYEVLRSKILIEEIADYTGSSKVNYAGKGKTFLNFGFVNFFPYIGFRINSKYLSFDVSGGFELALKVKNWESGKAETANGAEIFMPSSFSSPNLFDFRRRIQVSVNYKRMSPYIGYSRGLVSYHSGFPGGPDDPHSRMIRTGVVYRLKY